MRWTSCIALVGALVAATASAAWAGPRPGASAERRGVHLGFGVLVGQMVASGDYVDCHDCQATHAARTLSLDGGWALSSRLSLELVLGIAVQDISEQQVMFGPAKAYEAQALAALSYWPVRRLVLRGGLGPTWLGQDGDGGPDAGPHAALSVLAGVGYELVSRPGVALSLVGRAGGARYAAVEQTVVVYGLGAELRWFAIGR